MKNGEVIAVDLDGTLAYYTSYKGDTVIGKPIGPMVRRVKNWLAKGNAVVIFTARAGSKDAIQAIEDWCQKHLGQKLEVTNVKSPSFIEMWDDRCIQVEKNTGKLVVQKVVKAAFERTKR